MTLTNLLPWGRTRPAEITRYTDDADPFGSLHREMNRMFDDFTRGFGVPTRSGWPHIDVSETPAEVKIVAELPGLEEKDVEITLHDGVLTLAGEKKTEHAGTAYSERWHGRFRRSLQVGADIDPERVSAAFRNGVLTISLPRRAEAQSPVKRIAIGQH
jgi:HSP20 family protein